MKLGLLSHKYLNKLIVGYKNGKRSDGCQKGYIV